MEVMIATVVALSPQRKQGWRPIDEPAAQGRVAALTLACPAGSRTLFTPDGFLLTNRHVVGNSDRVRVRLNDGREMNGDVIGNDPWTDLAVVKSEESQLPYAAFGDSAKLRVGQLVVAIGSPLGFESTVTAEAAS